MSDFKQPGSRTFSLTDRLLIAADQAARTVLAESHAARPYPSADTPETVTEPPQRAHAAALMRVNHSGEISAQK